MLPDKHRIRDELTAIVLENSVINCGLQDALLLSPLVIMFSTCSESLPRPRPNLSDRLHTLELTNNCFDSRCLHSQTTSTTY